MITRICHGRVLESPMQVWSWTSWDTKRWVENQSLVSTWLNTCTTLKRAYDVKHVAGSMAQGLQDMRHVAVARAKCSNLQP